MTPRKGAEATRKICPTDKNHVDLLGMFFFLGSKFPSCFYLISWLTHHRSSAISAAVKRLALKGPVSHVHRVLRHILQGCHGMVNVGISRFKKRQMISHKSLGPREWSFYPIWEPNWWYDNHILLARNGSKWLDHDWWLVIVLQSGEGLFSTSTGSGSRRCQML